MEILYAALSLIGGSLGAFLSSYLSEKGKNLATKSDIEEITEKVESIKSDFAKDQEILRAELNLLVSEQTGIHADIKKAVYEYWDCLILLLSLSDYTRSEITEERVQEFVHFEREIDRVSDELQLKQTRLYLLISDEELNDLTEELVSDCSKLGAKFVLFLIKSRPFFEQLAIIYNAPSTDQTKYQEHTASVLRLEQEFDRETKEIAEKLDVNIKKFKEHAHMLLFKRKDLSVQS